MSRGAVEHEAELGAVANAGARKSAGNAAPDALRARLCRRRVRLNLRDWARKFGKCVERNRTKATPFV